MKAQNASIESFSNWSNCVDPTQVEKTKALTKMIFLFHKTSGFLDHDALKIIYGSIIHNKRLPKANEVPIHTRKKSDCAHDESIIRLHDLHLCPTHQVLMLRENMFPRIIAETKCSCEKCVQQFEIKDVVKHTCQPKKILSPALIRGKCVKGIYEWNPILEYITVACLCN